jgi:hypothetical protein
LTNSRLTIAHLSDIHLEKSGNPVTDVTAQIAKAISSVEPSPSRVLVIVSGDIAFSGRSTEYSVALRFFKDLETHLQGLCHSAPVQFVSVPGNHDCVLPKTEVKLRETLVKGVIPAIVDNTQDEATLDQLLKAQALYRRFRKRLDTHTTSNGLCEIVTIDHQGKKIQLNLYNTAILSQRVERQGELYLPLKHYESNITLSKEAALSISVFHHSYLWLESNVAVGFRGHIERTSDIALMGHQHYAHDFYKENSTGERVLYMEAPALQDEKYRLTSGFQVLLLDLHAQTEKSVKFRRNKDLYRPIAETEWRPLTVNRSIRADFRLSDKFDVFLNEPGMPLHHPLKGVLRLRDIFLFPDLTVRTAGTKPQNRTVRGQDVFSYASKSRRIIFQASGAGGKSSLAKMIFWEFHRRAVVIPLLLSGYLITSSSEDNILDLLWKTFGEEYNKTMLDEFRQLSAENRVLIVDDWHKAKLNAAGRRLFLDLASKFFERIFLFTDELYQIHEIVSNPETLLGFDNASLTVFGHALRGRLIDKWVTLGREYTSETKQINREIEDKERLLDSVMGKNTLPRVPFIILSLLEAVEAEKAESPEAGSFGYLYEVLVTTALSKTKGPKAQLERKYNVLARLAYRMYKEGAYFLPLSRIKQIAHEYSESILIAVDIDGMIADLTDAHVLKEVDGNYSFAYSHLLYYFIARYYRDNLDRDASLLDEIRRMADHVSSDQSSAILMFIVYFARCPSEIIQTLVANADNIYKDETPADLESDVAFLNRITTNADVDIPEEVDVAKNREEKRELTDQIEHSAAARERGKPNVTHDESLSDADAFDLAYRHIGLLGQVIRNFPGTLPGPEKLLILKSTYLLGLRALRSLLRLLDSSLTRFGQELSATMSEEGKLSFEKIRQFVDQITLLLSRACTISVIAQVSGSVGVPDLERAYGATLEIVGKNTATQLIDFAIELDHLPEFPSARIRELHKQFSNNLFADRILADLVLGRMLLIDVDPRIRQSMRSLFKLPPTMPLLMGGEKINR